MRDANTSNLEILYILRVKLVGDKDVSGMHALKIQKVIGES